MDPEKYIPEEYFLNPKKRGLQEEDSGTKRTQLRKKAFKEGKHTKGKKNAEQKKDLGKNQIAQLEKEVFKEGNVAQRKEKELYHKQNAESKENKAGEKKDMVQLENKSDLEQKQGGQLRERNIQPKKESSQFKKNGRFNLTAREVVANVEWKPFQPLANANNGNMPVVQRSSNPEDWGYSTNRWDRHGRQLLPGM